MNKYLFNYSESIILSLCEEVEYIKNRTNNINNSIKTCQNKILLTRLKKELNKLNINRLKILNIAENMFKRNCNELSIEFLLEVTKRSNSFQEI
ncbi:pilus assembly protein [Prochlorococcus marinus]|uniref:Pilus assembly protein n=1 Tax=Prochlorococcus marinus XMU1408 TaxID=2213228 RepID=A0A318R464_PROMR|nr:pilus assembly protein [Prochlorococcus marinus]MBW3041810.1 pilus assembly protein [Prochlorococcus marinus str. XMU1408]PYE02950.1 pilus assembly protein [Prochlorococcus marinus XMU1408]